MLDHVNIRKVLFLDIETVPETAEYDTLSKEMQTLWTHRTNRFKPDDIEADAYYFKKAGVYAEFGKIICISVGFFTKPEGENNYQFRLKSFYSDDEKEILVPFLEMLKKYFHPEHTCISGHNVREFDVPYLCRRTIINGLELPPILNVNDFKPWERPFLDTMSIWKFGDYKNFTSLHLLCTLLNIPTPKQDMQGSEVATVYWQDKDLERIKNYCQQDVLATAQLVLKFKNMPLLQEAEVLIVA